MPTTVNTFNGGMVADVDKSIPQPNSYKLGVNVRLFNSTGDGKNSVLTNVFGKELLLDSESDPLTVPDSSYVVTLNNDVVLFKIDYDPEFPATPIGGINIYIYDEENQTYHPPVSLYSGLLWGDIINVVSRYENTFLVLKILL